MKIDSNVLVAAQVSVQTKVKGGVKSCSLGAKDCILLLH